MRLNVRSLPETPVPRGACEMNGDDRLEVDVIAGLQGPGEHLVRVARELDGTLGAGELALDALLN